MIAAASSASQTPVIGLNPLERCNTLRCAPDRPALTTSRQLEPKDDADQEQQADHRGRRDQKLTADGWQVDGDEPFDTDLMPLTALRAEDGSRVLATLPTARRIPPLYAPKPAFPFRSAVAFRARTCPPSPTSTP